MAAILTLRCLAFILDIAAAWASQTNMRAASHHRACQPRNPGPLLNVVHGSLCASVIAHILRGTTMRSILGLVVTVVVIVIVLKVMGVL